MPWPLLRLRWFGVLFGSVLALLTALHAAEKAYDDPPVPLKTVAPEHPSELRAQKVSGMVSVAVMVDENGVVQNPTIQKSSDPAFEKPALEAIAKWKFKPAKKAGQPVAVKVVIPVKFAISD